MSESTDRRDADRLLAGLELGGLSAPDAAVVAQDLDPVLVYCVVRFLRENYPASDPAASGVLERVLTLTRTPSVVTKVKEGEQDPVSRWFESEHSFRDFRGRGPEMVGVLVEKLWT